MDQEGNNQSLANCLFLFLWCLYCLCLFMYMQKRKASHYKLTFTKLGQFQLADGKPHLRMSVV